jgi:hypothetical protein
MNFRTPLPFLQAIDSRTVRTVLPTDFRTQLLQEIPPQLRERAFFSAGVTNAEFLDRANSAIDDLLSGTVDRATKRLELKQLLARLEYRPVPGEEGTLTDLSGDLRLNLILDQNLQAAQGYGSWKQGQDPAILDLWPAQELIDTNPGQTDNRRNWRQIWTDAGGQFYGNRMIALKNDPIWTRISRFSVPYPPFDFGSYWDVADIDRNEAVALGLIDRDTELLPQDRGFNDDLQASPQVRSEALAVALQEHFQGTATLVDGVLRWVGGNN